MFPLARPLDARSESLALSRLTQEPERSQSIRDSERQHQAADRTCRQQFAAEKLCSRSKQKTQLVEGG
jgi:hypothetical protein